jgi:alkanesulfonate monooxygenase SsuD/methylene tetrahydromethanopterin reductase-like flavin-dependent oxidoreductase (luciferase family)
VKFGIQVFFQHGDLSMTQREMYKREIGLCVRAEELGLDYVLSPEHHSTDYSIAPDPTQMLSYLAARTSRIGLVTGAIILPWHHPFRVAEKVALLDYLSDGRMVLGFGRGLAKKEYDLLGVDMAEARNRFDEAAPMILDALDNGVMKGDGPFFPMPPARILPTPDRSFRDRFISIGRSQDSVVAAAELGAALAFVIQKPIEEHKAFVELYRERFLEVHGKEAPPVWTIDFLYIDEDRDKANQIAEKYIAEYYITVNEHYQTSGAHFKGLKGYEYYEAGAKEAEKIGAEAVARNFVKSNTFGDPNDVIDNIEHRRSVIGDHVALYVPSFAGLPYEAVNNTLTLFGEKVVPYFRDDS